MKNIIFLSLSIIYFSGRAQTATGVYVDGLKVDSIECFNFEKLQLVIPFNFGAYEDYVLIGGYGYADAPVGPLESFSGEWFAPSSFYKVLDKETIKSKHYQNGYFVYDLFIKGRNDAIGGTGRTYLEDCIGTRTSADVLTRGRIKCYKDEGKKRGMIYFSVFGRKHTSNCIYKIPGTLEKNVRSIYTCYPLQKNHFYVIISGENREKIGKLADYDNKKFDYSSTCNSKKGISIADALEKFKRGTLSANDISVQKDETTTIDNTNTRAKQGEQKASTQKDGPFKDLYDDGSVKQEGQYLNGKPSGTWKYYQGTGGKLSLTEEYLPNDVVKSTVYDKEGKITDVYSRKDNLYYGEMIKYEFGYKTVMNYKDNKLHGLFQIYNEKNQLTESGNYIEGKKDGEWKLYQNGKASKVTKYNNGTEIE